MAKIYLKHLRFLQFSKHFFAFSHQLKYEFLENVCFYIFQKLPISKFKFLENFGLWKGILKITKI